MYAYNANHMYIRIYSDCLLAINIFSNAMALFRH